MGPTHTQLNIQKIEQINTKAARFIAHNYTQIPGITTHIKQQLNMDFLQLRRQAHRLTTLYKITNNYIDIEKHEYLQNTTRTNTRNSHNQKYLTYHTHTDTYKHSFFPKTIAGWNRLPQHIVDSPTTETFRNRIHKHLNMNTHTQP